MQRVAEIEPCGRIPWVEKDRTPERPHGGTQISPGFSADAKIVVSARVRRIKRQGVAETLFRLRRLSFAEHQNTQGVLRLAIVGFDL
jgi:hypothetical protein